MEILINLFAQEWKLFFFPGEQGFSLEELFSWETNIHSLRLNMLPHLQSLSGLKPLPEITGMQK